MDGRPNRRNKAAGPFKRGLVNRNAFVMNGIKLKGKKIKKINFLMAGVQAGS